MSFDTSNLPINGGVLIAGLIYAGASVFVLGPLIGQRTIAKSDWDKKCVVGLHSEIETRRDPPKFIPKTDCRSLIGGFLPELGALCNEFGNPDLSGGTSRIMQEQERLRRQAEDRRLSLAAANAGSQCSCAANLVAEDRSWALHAGSFRLLEPSSLTNLDAVLVRALKSPHCAAMG